VHRLAQQCHSPAGGENLFRRQRFDRFQLVAVLSVLHIQSHKLHPSAPFQAAGPVRLRRKVVLQRSEQKRSELSLERIRARQRLVLKQMQEKALGQIPCLFRSVTPAADICVQGIPVDSVEFTERRPETGRLALGREQHQAPPSRTKSVWVLPERSLVRLQASTPSNTTLSGSSQISN